MTGMTLRSLAVAFFLSLAVLAGADPSTGPPPLATLSPPPAESSEEGNRLWQVSAGVFLPTDSGSGANDTEAGFSVSVERVLRCNTNSTCWLGSLRYTRYDLKDGGNIQLINPMAEYRWTGGSSRQLYVGMGVGAVFGRNSGGGSTFNFAYSPVVGMNFGNAFVEARYLGGVSKGENGFILGIGLRL